jgi:histone H3/H4
VKVKSKEFNVIKLGTAKKFCRQSLRKAESKMNVSRNALMQAIQETNVFVERAFQFAFIEAKKQKRKTILLQDIEKGLSQSKNLFIGDLISQLEWKLNEIKREVELNDDSRRAMFEKDNRGRKKQNRENAELGEKRS